MKVRIFAKIVLLAGATVAATAVAALPRGAAERSTPAVSAQNSATLEKLVHARTLAWFAGDADQYAKYTTKHFLWNGTPVRNGIRTDFPDARPFEITGFQVVEYANVAIVSYTLTEYLNYEEGAPFDRRRRTETWVRDEAGWKAAAAQSSESCTSNSGRNLCY